MTKAQFLKQLERHVQANVANARYTNQQNTDVEGTVGTGQIQVDLGSNTGGITFESP